MRTFEAKYSGTCDACMERIRIGDLATYAEDNTVHADCEDSFQPERQAEVCSTCWLTKPCDCEAE